MNFSDSMEKVLNYIENNLKSTIELETLATYMHCSANDLQRLFSLVFGLSLKQYIRKRRLSEAGAELQNSSQTILSLALDYQYESSTSFTRAFKSMHGITPSNARKEKNKLVLFSKIRFNMSVTGYQILHYTIVSKNSFKLIGQKERVTRDQIPKVSQAIIQNLKSKFSNEFSTPLEIYQGCSAIHSDIFDFFVALKVSEHYQLQKNCQLEEFIISSARWAIFSFELDELNQLRYVWEQLLTTHSSLKFLPSGLPELERFTKKNESSKFIGEIHIPLNII
ncbi:AraC family transcriptional regulator [Enterococcus ureilyticus]|uniref:AraC family transcriptional regulator n=1 Tax=Enterococcus ureilyticus TaxID=1131292 RepID=UPI001A916B5D|nr:AraC family transcriptional regulator [Enterococcus ureilyticus]MBO0446737.1 AraC family transcriptional regulator [Enterococcus ureilyticus]